MTVTEHHGRAGYQTRRLATLTAPREPGGTPVAVRTSGDQLVAAAVLGRAWDAGSQG